MAGSEGVQLRVEAVGDEDAGELAWVVSRLRAELMGLDVAAAEPAPGERGTEGVKGVEAVAGDLLVWLGPAGLGAVLAKVADWVRRRGRVVEVTVGGDTLKLGQASKEQQDRLVETFVARHGTGS